MYSLASLTDKVIQNPLFLKLKNVVENGKYHDHEVVYDHVLKVKDIATREIAGDFITDPTAKKGFTDFVNQDYDGYKRAGLMILTALVHDIGKCLKLKENGETRPLLVTDSTGNTYCPGHEHWGSTIVPELLKDYSLPDEVINHISKVVRNHDIFNPVYFEKKGHLNWDLLVNDVKSRAEGAYIESLFNIYCDCLDAEPFQDAKNMIIKLFNEPELYKERFYVLP